MRGKVNSRIISSRNVSNSREEASIIVRQRKVGMHMSLNGPALVLLVLLLR